VTLDPTNQVSAALDLLTVASMHQQALVACRGGLAEIGLPLDEATGLLGDLPP
jgi:hypothetical protein